MLNPGFEILSADRLRNYIETQEEKDYLLVDVRQPEEYAQVEKSHMQMLANAIEQCPGMSVT